MSVILRLSATLRLRCGDLITDRGNPFEDLLEKSPLSSEQVFEGLPNPLPVNRLQNGRNIINIIIFNIIEGTEGQVCINQDQKKEEKGI